MEFDPKPNAVRGAGGRATLELLQVVPPPVDYRLYAFKTLIGGASVSVP